MLCWSVPNWYILENDLETLKTNTPKKNHQPSRVSQEMMTVAASTMWGWGYLTMSVTLLICAKVYEGSNTLIANSKATHMCCLCCLLECRIV